MKSKFKCVFAIVNNGFSEVAMETARSCGAKGGTILNGRGTVSKEAEKFFNISITPEKEIIMILAKSDIVDGLLKGLYNAIGSKTQAQGLVFAMPVDETVGIEEKTAKKAD
jgi:nitrogen regulatory protein PII